MKKQCAVFLLFIVVITIVSVQAQNAKRDVVYLKNGSIIKGSVVETVADSIAKIQTSDGSIFVFKMSEVEKIEKDTLSIPAVTAKPQQEPREEFKPLFGVFGGLAIPTGDFADELNGGAKNGFGFGLQCFGGGKVSFLFDVSYISNPCDLSKAMGDFGGSGSYGHWTLIPIMGGVKLGTSNPTGANFFIAPIIGFNIGISPEMEYKMEESGLVGSVKMPSATNTAFSYGILVELTANHFLLGAKYIACKPKYTVNATGTFTGSMYGYSYSGSMSMTMTIEQSTSVLLLYAGIVF